MRHKSDVNRVTLTGRLAREPELRMTPNGDAVCDLFLANNKQTKSGQKSVFPKVTVWHKTAENLAKILEVGDFLLVEGELADDNFIVSTESGDEFRTSGRLKIDRANVKILRKKLYKTTKETQND